MEIKFKTKEERDEYIRKDYERRAKELCEGKSLEEVVIGLLKIIDNNDRHFYPL